MIRQWLRKRLLKLDENSTQEELWKYMPTMEMFHPVLRDSLNPDMTIRDGSEFLMHIEEPVAGCFVFPLFSERYCRFLMDAGDKKGTWGKDKNDPYTAFEIDLQHMNYMVSGYHEAMVCMKVINNVLAGLFDGYKAQKVQNSFLIKYTLDTCLKMDMHHDENSLVSVSINLNDNFEGGGINFVRAPDEIICPKAGYASMFAGNPFACHRAVPITKGNRYVLVYWLK